MSRLGIAHSITVGAGDEAAESEAKSLGGHWLEYKMELRS